MASDFATQPETLGLYPFFEAPNEDEAFAFISLVYLNLFNRAPDQSGLDFWGEALIGSITGENDLSVGDIILSIIQGAQDGVDGNDRSTVLNKIAAATAWTDAADAADIDYTNDADAQASAKLSIEAVTDAEEAVDAAKASIDSFFGTSLTLSGADQIDEGAANTFTASLASAATQDVVVTFQLVAGDTTAANQGTTVTNLNDFAIGAFNPVSVTIPAGSMSATFDVTSIADDLTELPEGYAVTATAGYTTVGKIVTVLDSTPADEAETFTLTSGVDVVLGGSKNDTVNALIVNPTGEIASTLTRFDSVDGGAGIDTLNIFTGNSTNSEFPEGASVRNVEIVNIYNLRENAAPITDASDYAGVEQLWQINTATDVTNLEAQTTAGFRDIEGLKGAVTATKTATSVSVALDGVVGGIVAPATALGEPLGVLQQVGVLELAGDSLETVNVSGNLDLEEGTDDGVVVLGITPGSDVETVTVNSDLRLDVFFRDAASVTTVDATGATAGISIGADTDKDGLVATSSNTTISSITTGDAADLVFLTTETSKVDDVDATVSTGAGDDLIGVATTGDGKVTVDAGDGDDLIDLTAGSDTNELLAVGNSFDGGAGDDTLVINAQKTYTDATLVLLRDNATNIETLVTDNVSGTTTLDVSKLQGEFDTVAFAGHGTATVTKVADEAIVSQNGVDLVVTAAGYDFDDAEEFGGDLNITVKADDFGGELPAPYVMPVEVEANGSNVTLDVVAENTIEDRSGYDDSAALLGVDRLKGNAETVTVNLSSGVNDNDGTESNNFALVSINAEDNADLMPNLTSLDLNGNGIAFVENETGSKLATIDASDLDSTLLADYPISVVDFAILFDEAGEFLWSLYGTEALEAGDKGFGLIYQSDNADLVETVTLSGGVDIIDLVGASTIEKMDTVNGLSLEVDADGNLTNQSDLLRIEPKAAEVGYEKLTVNEIEGISEDADTLELYLIEVAALDKDNVVFDFGGDTYVYNDLGDAGYNDTDGLVKLTGGVDIDAALASLNYGVVS